MSSRKKGKQKEPGIWEALDGKGYIAEVSYTDTETGQRVREKETTNRLDDAQAWQKSRKVDALRGEITRKKKKGVKLFKDFSVEYYRAWSQNRKPSHYQREKRRIEFELTPYFGNKPLHAITRKSIEDFIVRRRETGSSPATANRVLCRIKNMLKKAVDWGYIDSNPAAGIQQAREVVKEADYLTKYEVGKLLQASSKKLRPLLLTAVYTGMRFGELMALEWRDIDVEKAIITVRDPKNRETRHIPMNRAVCNELEDLQKQQAQTEGGIVRPVFLNPQTKAPYVDVRKGLNSALGDAKITRPFTFHGLRHTAASHLIMAGVDIRTVGKILGHKTAQITLRYAHLAPDFLKGAVDKLDFSLPSEPNDVQTGEMELP